MNYMNILKLSKNMALSSAYIFINKESYLYNHTLEMIRNDYVDENLLAFNYTVIDASLSTYNNIYDALMTLPIMSEYKITLIENLDQLNLEDNEINDLIKLGVNSNDNISIFSFNKKKAKLYNRLKKEKIDIVEFIKLNENDFKKWVTKKFYENGKKLKNETLQFYVRNSLYNDRNQNLSLYQIENEIKKIALLNKEIVEIDDLKRTMVMPLEMNVFSLTDFLVKGDLKSSFKKLSELILKGHSEYELMPLLTKQYHNMLVGKVLNLKGHSNQEIKEVLGFKSDFPVKMILNRIKKIEKKKLLYSLNQCIIFESELKSTSVNKRAHIENLFVKLVEHDTKN